jgi:chromosome segregation ATPase
MAEVLEDKIQGLLAKRTELADRLDNLEKLRAETNERVYNKIRKDYDTQLQEVLSGINEERGTLESKVEDLRSKIDEKENLHTQQSDKVDELQMRARLKEFDENDKEFNEELNSAKKARNRTADELETLRAELADLNKVLKDVDAATSGTGSAPSAEPVEEAEEIGELELEEDLELEADEDGVKCQSCGHVNPPQKLACEECGSSLEEDEDLVIDDDFDLVDDDVDLDL